MRERMLGLLQKPMAERHRNADDVFRRRYDELRCDVDKTDMTKDDKLLIGAYFSQEFTFESAALFNPSVIRLPNRAPDVEQWVRILLSLRGIGEWHIFSVTFRSGHRDGGDGLVIDPPSPRGVPPPHRARRPGMGTVAVRG